MWNSGQETLRHIEIARTGGGWTVSEATVANAQFFWRRSAAESAVRGLGARLAEAGEASEITIRPRDGESRARFVCAMGENQDRIDP